MTNSKSTKRALVSSALAVFLCVAMLIGTTFAWFTDTATTGVNKIQAGTLDVALEVKEGGNWVSAEGRTLDFVKATGHESEAILWEPGCTYSLPELRIVNNGNLALKYKVVITGINGDAKLNEAIEWTIGAVAQGTEQKLAAGAMTEAFTISGTMKTTAGNEYQGLSIDGIAITVYATQDTVEFDSTTNEYDKDATLPSFWDGRTTTAVTESPEDNMYHITSAEQFAWVMQQSQNTSLSSVYYNDSFVLECDIDFGGATITGFGNSNVIFAGSFDGKNHTVSNFVIDNTPARLNTTYYAGLFNYYSYGTLKNLNVKNATVIGDMMVGALLGNIDNNAVVNNCSVEDCTVIGYRKVGGAIGYGSAGSASNISVKDTTVYCSVTEQSQGRDQCGKVIGYLGNGLTVTGSNDENVTIVTGATSVANGVVLNGGIYEIYNAEGLFWFDNLGTEGQYNKNIKLTADIDLGGRAWTPVCDSHTQYSGTFDGNGHTISGLYIDDSEKAGNEATGLFAWTNGIIKNLTIDGANVIGNHWVGAIVGFVQAGTVENCAVKNSTVKAIYANADRDGDKAGAVVGYVNQGAATTSIASCTAENCKIYAVRDAGQIIGCASASDVTGCTATNVTVNAISGHDRSGENITNGIIGRS